MNCIKGACLYTGAESQTSIITGCSGNAGQSGCTAVLDSHIMILIVNGVAVVDTSKCKGCGMCAAACPKGLIEVVRADKTHAVRCSNKDKGPAVKKVCSAGCLGCKICEKQCEHEAIQVEGNVAHIDYDKCVGCGKCAEKCPAKCIAKQ